MRIKVTTRQVLSEASRATKQAAAEGRRLMRGGTPKPEKQPDAETVNAILAQNKKLKQENAKLKRQLQK
jgi:hypothetical protein